MATYKYKGTKNNGQVVEGIVKASDEISATLQARSNVEIIDYLKEVNESPDLFASLTTPKIDIKQLALVCRQFSIILKAGLPIITSIRLVANQAEDKHLKEVMLNVCDDVKGGESVSDAFENRDPNLPTTFIETIRAGEASGKMDVAFDRLANYFDKRAKTSSKVSSALLYPIIVLVLAVIVIAILMIYAVPSFTESFSELGTELPWVTKALIAMSDFFIEWTWLLVIIIVLAYLAYRLYINRESGHYKVDSFKLRIPVLGKISLMSSASEFANSFATMMAAGIPVIKALEITGKSISNFAVSRDVLSSCELVEGGYKIGDSLREKTVLPDLLVEIVKVAENSGSMESSLEVISDFYDNEVETATTTAVAVLEPIMIVILAVIVLFILLAVYLPMFSMYDSL